MIPRIASLREIIRRRAIDLDQQGYDTTALGEDPAANVTGYDDAVALAQRLAELPIRDGWPYHEPDTLQHIESCSEIGQLTVASLPADSIIRDKVKAGFLGSVCGCILGKPLEIHPDMKQLEGAASAVGEWPLDDYISQGMLDLLPRRHPTWGETVRGKITHVAPDDDINYTIIGMLLLEQHGLELSRNDVAQFWLRNLPVLRTFGPERNTLVTAALHSIYRAESLTEETYEEFAQWNGLWNFFNEFCGAQIRADAYGYAFPGDPVSAARFAYVDASLTHRKTGVYATMFTAAAIALAFTEQEPLRLFRRAAMVVPGESRFRAAIDRCLAIVDGASNWLDAYRQIHQTYQQYGHCRIIQETGTLINTVHFAESVSDGFCKQVMQGNDTDSYGATAGALCGVRYGMAGLESRWLKPFQDTIHTTIAGFHEQSLSAIADRMVALHRKVPRAT